MGINLWQSRLSLHQLKQPGFLRDHAKTWDLTLLGPMPAGEYLLVLLDNFSQWVKVIKSTASKVIITCLDTVFLTWSTCYFENRQGMEIIACIETECIQMQYRDIANGLEGRGCQDSTEEQTFEI